MDFLTPKIEQIKYRFVIYSSLISCHTHSNEYQISQQILSFYFSLLITNKSSGFTSIEAIIYRIAVISPKSESLKVRLIKYQTLLSE